MTRIRLGLVAISPVYYKTPLYRRVATDPRLDFKAIFASDAGVRAADLGYGRPVAWDTDLLEGYESSFLRRASQTEAADRFFSSHDLDVVRTLRRERFEFLWIEGYNNATLALAWAYQASVRRPVCFREEQTLIHPRPLTRTMVKEVTLKALFRSAAGFYIGSENRRWFEHYGIPSSRLFHVPYASDLEDDLVNNHGSRAEAKLRARSQFGIPDDGLPVVLTVSRLIPKKNLKEVIDAVASIQGESSCWLLVVGAGSERSALEARARGAGLERVRFAGLVPRLEIADCYRAGDIFVLNSSLHETWGVVVNEAMAFGLPVLVSERVGSAVDLVSDGRNGYVIRGPSRMKMLASKLGALVVDEGLRHRMGEESREIEANWTVELAAQGVRNAVAAAVGPRRWAIAGSAKGTR